jgi:PKD repeat protein
MLDQLSAALATLRPAILPALRDPFDMRGRDGNTDPFVAYDGLVQSFYTAGQTGVWYDARNPAYLTVNDDGTGGVPLNGQAFGRFIDRTGGGNHATQATAAIRPVFSSDEKCAFFPNKDAPTTNNGIRFAQSLSVPGGAAGTQNCTGVMIVDSASLPVHSLPSGAVTAVNQNQAAVTTKWPCAKTFVAWRFSATGHEIWVNNTQYTGAALASAALRAIRLGIRTTGQIAEHETHAFYSYVLFNSAFDNTNFAALRNAALAASGANTLSVDTLGFWGDSNTQSVGSMGRHWTRRIARSTNLTCYNGGRAAQGYALMSYDLHTFLQLIKGAGKNTVTILMGVNDNGQYNTTAVDSERNLRAHCGYARSEGFRSLVMTYPKTNGGGGAYCAVMNPAIRANWVEYADEFFDVVNTAGLTDSTNATNFTDTTHFADPGSAIVASNGLPLIVGLQNRPWPNFTANNRDGTSVNATFTSTADGSPTTYEWDYTNDGSIDSTATSPSNTYSTAGNYAIRHRATNASGTGQRIRPFYINVYGTVTAVNTNRVGNYIANTGITQAGGFASAWADQDGILGSLLQATGSAQPAVGGSGQIITDGTARWMQTNIGTLGNDWSAIMKIRLPSFTGNRVIIEGRQDAASNRMRTANASPFLRLEATGNGVSARMPVALNSWFTVYIGQIPDCSSSIRPQCLFFDGGEPQANSRFQGQSAANGITIGATFNGAQFANVEYGLIHVFSRRLSYAQIAQEFAFARTIVL